MVEEYAFVAREMGHSLQKGTSQNKFLCVLLAITPHWRKERREVLSLSVEGFLQARYAISWGTQKGCRHLCMQILGTRKMYFNCEVFYICDKFERDRKIWVSKCCISVLFSTVSCIIIQLNQQLFPGLGKRLTRRSSSDQTSAPRRDDYLWRWVGGFSMKICLWKESSQSL